MQGFANMGRRRLLENPPNPLSVRVPPALLPAHRREEVVVVDPLRELRIRRVEGLLIDHFEHAVTAGIHDVARLVVELQPALGQVGGCEVGWRMAWAAATSPCNGTKGAPSGGMRPDGVKRTARASSITRAASYMRLFRTPLPFSELGRAPAERDRLQSPRRSRGRLRAGGERMGGDRPLPVSAAATPAEREKAVEHLVGHLVWPP